jgi:hypothetical protein
MAGTPSQPSGVFAGLIIGPGRDEAFPYAQPEFRAYLAVAETRPSVRSRL